MIQQARAKSFIALLSAAVVLAATVLVGQLSATAQTDHNLVVRVRGATGTEVVRIYTDTDEILSEQVVRDEWHDVALTVPASANQVYVGFVNDAIVDGQDRNLSVSGVTWNATDVVDAKTVESKGVWDGTRCDVVAVNGSDTLHCNGWFRFDVPGGGTDPSTYVTVVARGSTGSELMQFEVDGEIATEFRVSSTPEEYSYYVPNGMPGEVRVNFVNDGLDAAGADRNLEVLSAQVGDQLFDPIDVRSKGVWNGTDCGIGFREQRLLACNGWFEFIVDPIDPPPPPPGDLEVIVRAKGSTGAEKMLLTVGEAVVGETDVSTDWADYSFFVDSDTQALRVEFRNDGRNADGGDRNLIVDHLRIGSETIEAETLLSKGVWNGSSCNEVAVHGEEFLACNGWFQYEFEAPPPPPPGGDREIRVRLRGNTGNESAFLEVDGERAADIPVGSDWTEFVGAIPDAAVKVRVVFDNDGFDPDGGDRNLQIDWIEVSGDRRQATDLLSLGAWVDGRCDVRATRGYDTLVCNGWFEYTADTGDIDVVDSWTVAGSAEFWRDGVGATPVLSGDGDAVLYYSASAGAFEPYIRLVGAGSATLIGEAADSITSVVAGDGAESAMYRVIREGFNGAVYWTRDPNQPQYPGVDGTQSMSDDGRVTVAWPAPGALVLWEAADDSRTSLGFEWLRDFELTGNGSHLISLAGPPGEQAILARYNISSGETVEYTMDDGVELGSASDDGTKALLYERNSPDTFNALRVIDLDTGVETPVTAFTTADRIALSGDGSTVVLMGSGSVAAIDVASGESGRYWHPPDTRVVGVADDGQRVVLVTEISESEHRISVGDLG